MTPPRFKIRSLIPSNFIKKQNTSITIIFAVLLIQIISTHLTNTQGFSIQAYIRNILIGFSIYYIYLTGNPLWILMPIVFQLGLNLFFYVIKTRLQSDLTVEYLYNDYFEYVVTKDKTMSYYTEGSFTNIIGIDTLDTSTKNVKFMMNYGKKAYESGCMKYRNTCLELPKIMKLGQVEKFKWITENLGIKSGVRVLEIGFGKLDLMRFIRDSGADVVGINISTEHVKNAKKEGFNAYVHSFMDLDKASVRKKLGVFDVIITNGSLEYLVNLMTPKQIDKVFYNFGRNINRLLVKGGRWYTTTLHLNDSTFDRKKQNPDTLLYNYMVGYPLLFGNSGGYPINRDGLTKNVVKAGFRVNVQENRWLDYYITTIIWYIYYKEKLRNMSTGDKIKYILKNINLFIAAPNFIESYLCYGPNNYNYHPWLWQFIARKDNKYQAPVSHEWIIFEKK